jgi:hypothetical protein
VNDTFTIVAGGQKWLQKSLSLFKL